jgi:glycosyltransferase involved in cell wall biosynthesis
MKTIGLCMIVKDEAAVIQRCLDSVRPLVDYVLVEDTGSTDGTQQIIRDYLRRENLPGEVFDAPWRDFAHNRSLALARLRARTTIDYALIIDADDTLVPDDGFDPAAFKRSLALDQYSVLVHDGPVSYMRPQLCSNRLEFRYRGVLHEFLAAPPGARSGTVRGFHVLATRQGARSQDPEKYSKDAAVFERALAADQDPDLRGRYIFYLAQSYRDAGRHQEAADAYAKRAAMAGWDEETWYARLQEARCLRQVGDESGFLRAALAAYNRRPQRAEPLYDLARYYREQRMNEAGLLFCEAGLALPRPEKDILFIEDFVYSAGLREEYAIMAFYAHDPARKQRGFDICNGLALDRQLPKAARDLARSNLFYYIDRAEMLLPSLKLRRVDFTPPAGYHPMNPSVARQGSRLVMVQRTVNSVMIDGRYETANGEPFETRNFLLRLDDDLGVEHCAEILPPADMPPPRFPQVRGFEDMRLFAWKGGLWCSAMVRELTTEGWCEQVLARIDGEPPGPYRLCDWRVLRPVWPRQHEKNWMPLVADDRLQFVYSSDPTRVVDERGQPLSETTPPIGAENFRGSSQAIHFDGGWLTIVHEVLWREGRRFYQHRFVWFDRAMRLRRVSRPYVWRNKGVEYAVGLAWHPDGERIVVSLGIDDAEAWIGAVAASDIRAALQDAAPPTADRARGPTGHKPAPPPATSRSRVAAVGRPKRQPGAPSIFLHASWRTGSTWFWGKFRELPETLCYYEPLHAANATVTRGQALRWDTKSWPSGHPAMAPYWREYLPLIQKSGGIRLFDRLIPFTWFIPEGGLRGRLRDREKRYLALLLRQAERVGKTAVLGLNLSLGRIWPMKDTFGGIHIFQYRDLTAQWLSYLSFRANDDPYFFETTAYIINRDDDPYFVYLKNFFLDRARNKGETTETAPIKLLLALPVADMFSMFMAAHIYLYLHAMLTADMTVDVTRMARDPGYRISVEAELTAHTGLAVSFADVREERQARPQDFVLESIDWDEMRQHGKKAAEQLAGLGAFDQLSRQAGEWIDAALAEVENLRRFEAAALAS